MTWSGPDAGNQPATIAGSYAVFVHDADVGIQQYCRVTSSRWKG